MSEDEIINAYINGTLPAGITVYEVPITINVYKEVEVKGVPELLPSTDKPVGGLENIQITHRGDGFYAGYGAVTKTLIIGKVEGER